MKYLLIACLVGGVVLVSSLSNMHFGKCLMMGLMVGTAAWLAIPFIFYSNEE